MLLTPQQLLDNWNEHLNYVNLFSDDRKEKVLDFYKKYQDRLVILPASHKKEYHNAFPGGYIEHVNRVIKQSIALYRLWSDAGCDVSGFSKEELIFSAMFHDLGKLGDENHDSYIPQDDKWRRDNLGEQYKFNTKLAFASVPDRGLYLLQSHDIKYSFNEMVTIQIHDGLYDEANKKYLMTYMPEQKPRTCLPFIVHQADMLAARFEFEREWGKKLLSKEEKNHVDNKGKGSTIKGNSKPSNKAKALNTVGSSKLLNSLNNL